jgi:hypothetical protein
MGLSTFSRRSVLRAFAGVGAASPLVGLFRDLWAADSLTPPRFCVLGSQHGYAPQLWRPRAADGAGAATETGWTLEFEQSSLSPLEKHKDSLVIIEGLDLTTDSNPEINTNGSHNTLSVLTGMHPRGNSSTSYFYSSSGPSIDVFLAELLGTTGFVFSPVGYEGGNNTVGSFRADGTGIVAEFSLQRSLLSWFGWAAPDLMDPKATAKKNAEHAVLDYLGAQAAQLRGRLAGPERAKLDAHLDGLSSIARRVDSALPVACRETIRVPDTEGSKPPGDQYMPMVLDFTAELLACDLTRVVNVSIDPVGRGVAPWLAGEDPVFQSADLHNDIAHRYLPDDDASHRLLSIVNRFYAKQVSYFIDRLKAIPEGNGTVYDNTIILWANDFGDPARHMHVNVPFVLAGGGGRWKKGRYLTYGLGLEEDSPQDPHNRLLISLANEYGANLTVFGDPAYPGELPGLVA